MTISMNIKIVKCSRSNVTISKTFHRHLLFTSLSSSPSLVVILPPLSTGKPSYYHSVFSCVPLTYIRMLHRSPPVSLIRSSTFHPNLSHLLASHSFTQSIFSHFYLTCAGLRPARTAHPTYLYKEPSPHLSLEPVLPLPTS